MHDAYFGIRLNGESRWLNTLTNPEYEDQTHIIFEENQSGLRFSVRYFPLGLEANALIMSLTVENPQQQEVEIGGKINLKLGTGRRPE